MIITDYKLFENLDQAKKILRELNISETNPKFLELKELLKNNLGWMGTFTKWYIKDHEPFDQIKEIFYRLTSRNNEGEFVSGQTLFKFPMDGKNINDFKKSEDLYDFLTIHESNVKVEQLVKLLPSYTKKYITPELKNLIAQNIDLYNGIKTFFINKGGRYNEHSRWWSLPKQFKTYGEWLTNETKKEIKNLRDDWTLEFMLNKCKGLNVDIVVSNPDVLVIRVKDFKASEKLGNINWCISTSESQFYHYVNQFTSQYFVYDFTRDIDDNWRMIGATIGPTGEISNCHLYNDKSLSGKEADEYFENL